MTWTDELSTGIPEIDRQHQRLYELTEALHAAMRRGDRPAVPPIVALLLDHAEAHFAVEERSMAELSYPSLAFHRVAHESFISDLRAFEEALATGVRPSVMLDLSQFLTCWMRDHVRGSDLPFGRWAARSDRRAPRAHLAPRLRPLASTR